MSEIKIETLSKIHIGNGTFLQKGNDFIVEDDVIYVLSVEKLGKIIGSRPEAVQQWAEAIFHGAAESFVKSHIKELPRSAYAKRQVECLTEFSGRQCTLKECMHDGMGRPYIPGSSIKGAIRTALMATLARKRIAGRLRQEKDRRKWKGIVSGMEREVLHFDALTKSGKKDTGPSTDLFRFLQTGDAFFDRGVEVALTQINLNMAGRQSLLDTRKQQAVEAIREGASSQFRMNVDDLFYQKSGVDGLQDLFTLINKHIYNLLCDEMEFWCKGEGARYTGQDDYIDQLEVILDLIDECQPNECVLRLGQANGWRFITGAWLEEADKSFFNKEIVPLCRPKNSLYQGYPFPKSRRIAGNSNVFGFVKMTVL